MMSKTGIAELASCPEHSVAAERPAIRSLAVRGSVLTLAGMGAEQVLRVGSNIVLARLLFPGAFGLMALVYVCLHGVAMLSDVGIRASIVHHERGEDAAFLNTAWTIQVVRGALLWLCVCALAWPAAWAFSHRDPGAWRLAVLLPVAGFASVVAGLCSTNRWLAGRRLAIGRLVLTTLGGKSVGIAAVVVLACLYRSVWAIVIGGIIGSTATLALTHTILPGPRSRLQWDPKAVQSIVRFGKWIFVSTALTFLAAQADRLLLGALVPMKVLGVYCIALGVASLAGEIIGRLGERVLFPALAAQARSDRATLPEKVLLSRGVLLEAGIWLLLGTVLLGPVFFQSLYDSRYHDAAWMVQLLCIPVWFGMLRLTSTRVILALGQSQPLAASNTVRFAVSIAAAAAGYFTLGITGFILGYAVGALAGLAVIEAVMVRAGLSTIRQDVRHTLVFLGLALGASLLSKIGPRALGTTTEPAELKVQLLVAAGCLFPYGLWVARRALRAIKQQ